MQRNHKYHLHYKRVKTLPRLIFYNNNNDQLRLCLFLMKITSGNAFRKWGCLVGPENSIFRKLKSVDPKKKPLTTEMLLHFYFSFKAFPENERERGRERARARKRRRSSPRSRAPTPVRDRDRDPRSRLTVRSREGKIAIFARSRRRSCGRRTGNIFVVDDFFFLGCGLCFLICVFLLFFQTPENIFRKIFWNATKHMEIFSFSGN